MRYNGFTHDIYCDVGNAAIDKKGNEIPPKDMGIIKDTAMFLIDVLDDLDLPENKDKVPSGLMDELDHLIFALDNLRDVLAGNQGEGDIDPNLRSALFTVVNLYDRINYYAGSMDKLGIESGFDLLSLIDYVKRILYKYYSGTNYAQDEIDEIRERRDYWGMRKEILALREKLDSSTNLNYPLSS